MQVAEVAPQLLRDAAFSDDILEALGIRKGDGGPTVKLWDATRSIDALEKEPLVIVLRLDELTMPTVSGSALDQLMDTNVSYTNGEVSAAAVLVDWKTAEIMCHRAFKAGSSAEITYKSKSNLSRAAMEDFKANVQYGARAALRGKDGG